MNTTKHVLPANTKAVLSLVVLVAVGLTTCTPQQKVSQQSAPGSAGAPVVDTAKLRDVLTYHIVDHSLTCSEVSALNGKVNVVGSEIVACNGVIHVIDQTLSQPAVAATGGAEAKPASCQTIAAILRSQARFSDFTGALESAGEMNMLDKDGTYTVFAPPNGVFVAPMTVNAAGGTSNSVDANSAGGKITICHHTGSAKNPYVEITISTNGLNGHDKHPGDIIPAPAGGCPTK